MTPTGRACIDGRLIPTDHWSGYQVERRRFLQFLADRRPNNPVVLTGDIHNHWVNDLRVDFDDPKSPTIGTEFVGTSISSGGDGEDMPLTMGPVTTAVLDDTCGNLIMIASM